MLGLRQAERALALLPFAAFLQKLDTFKTLQDGTLAAYGTGCFEAGMFGHDLVFVKGSENTLHHPFSGRRDLITEGSELGKRNLAQ